MVQTKLMVQNQTYGSDKDSWYRHGHMVQTWTHCIDMCSWYWERLMIRTQTYDTDKTPCIDLSSWYSISTPESHKRAECCPYARLFGTKTESYKAISLHLIGFYCHFGCISQRALVILKQKINLSFSEANVVGGMIRDFYVELYN